MRDELQQPLGVPARLFKQSNPSIEDSISIHVSIKEFSLSGMRIESDTELAIGDRLELLFVMPKQSNEPARKVILSAAVVGRRNSVAKANESFYLHGNIWNTVDRQVVPEYGIHFIITDQFYYNKPNHPLRQVIFYLRQLAYKKAIF